jgi:hypothetical protein
MVTVSSPPNVVTVAAAFTAECAIVAMLVPAPRVKVKDLPDPDRPIMPFVPWAPSGAKLEDRAPHPVYPKRRRRGAPLPGQEMLLLTETDTGPGVARISPFREETDSVPRAIKALGVTKGVYEGVRVQNLDWPFLLGTGWQARNQYGAWNHLKDWEILDMYEAYPETHATYESWLEDGFPAVVLVRRGSGRYRLMDGDDQAQLAYAMGRPAIPGLLVTVIDQ